MSRDAQLRLAAAEHVKRLAVGNILTSEELRAGFQFEGERIPLINPQRGIFKPRGLEFVLSVRTVYPRTGARVWYDDQRQVHEQIERGREAIEYAFMGSDPNAADNRWLREAGEAQVPLLYFLGIAPGRYTPLWPTYISDWSAAELKVQLAFGADGRDLEDSRCAGTTLRASPSPSAPPPGDLSGGGSHCLRWTLCSFWHARAKIARRCSHHRGPGRGVWSAGGAQWVAAVQDPSCCV
jgi:hypothetical protein